MRQLTRRSRDHKRLGRNAAEERSIATEYMTEVRCCQWSHSRGHTAQPTDLRYRMNVAAVEFERKG